MASITGAPSKMSSNSRMSVSKAAICWARRTPLLVPGTRQAQSLVPGGKLHGPRPRPFRQHHRQHLDEDAIDVILGLLFGQAQRVDLHAVAESAQPFVLDAIALARDLVPQQREGAHLANLGDDPGTGIDEEAKAPDHRWQVRFRNLAGGRHRVENRNRVGEREGKLLDRRRPRLLKMVGADVDRIPARDFAAGKRDHVGGQSQRRLRREDVRSAREIFLEDVVLGGAGEVLPRHPLPLGYRDIEREQPSRRRIDGHGGVHAVQRDAGQQRFHIAEMGDGNADLADLPLRQRMVGVVAGLGRKVERDGKTGLAARQVLAEERVRGLRRAVPGIGTKEPGLVAPRPAAAPSSPLRHRRSPELLFPHRHQHPAQPKV